MLSFKLFSKVICQENQEGLRLQGKVQGQLGTRTFRVICDMELTGQQEGDEAGLLR